MRQLLGCCLGVVLSALLSGSAAAQQKSPQPSVAPAVMPVTLNATAAGDFPVLLDPGGEIFMRTDDLRRAGLTSAKAERLLLVAAIEQGRDPAETSGYISLRQLAPLVSAQFDEATLGVAITADASLFAATRIQADSFRPANVIYSKDNSAFMNYSVSSAGGHSPSVFGEAGTSLRGNLLYTSFSRSGGVFSRGTTSYTIDQREQTRRWVFGDSFVSTADAIGGAASLAGVTVSRNYGLDPYIVRQPGVALVGNATTPSTITVYVNGIRVAEREVPPGQFELRGLPLTGGAGQVELVVRDAFGREFVQTQSFYSSNVALAKGMSEYAYSLGKLRDLNSTSGRYTDAVVVARHRVGVTDWFTGGGRLEATRGVWSAGPTFALRTRFGDLSGSAAASSEHGVSGQAASAAYDHVTRRFSFGAQMVSMSRDYATLSLDRGRDRALLQTAAYASYALPRVSLSILVGRTEMRDSGENHSVTLSSSFPVTSRVTAVASGGFVDGPDGRKNEFSFGLSVYLGHNMGLNTMVAEHDERREAIVELQRPLPQGTGFGYRLRSAASDGTNVSNADLQYQSTWGRHEIIIDPSHASDTIVSTAGGLIYQGGRFSLTRPVQDSFALVRVPGVAGVRIYSANQLIGRTDARGDLIVPSLLSYYGNDIRIEDTDVPLEYTVDTVQKKIAPPYRGGALALFPVKRISTVVGRLRVSAGSASVTPSYGQLTISRDGQTFTSPVGGTGEFYLESVPPGQWSAVVEWGEGVCRFPLVIPELTGAVANLETVTCTMEGRSK